MSKAKRVQQQTESLAPAKLFVDPVNMVVLRSASGHAHMVDRNCVLVSRRCRRALEAMEEQIQLESNADARGGAVGGQTAPTTALFYRVRNTKHSERNVSAADSTGGSADGQGVSASEEEQGYVSVPLTVLAEASERRLAAAAAEQHQPHSCRSGTSPSIVSGSIGRRSGGTLSSTVAAASTSASPSFVSWTPAFVTLEDSASFGDGAILYPVIDIPDVPDDLVDMSVGFMHFKYHADTDHYSDKRHSVLSSPVFDEHHDEYKMLAASVILEL